MWLATNAAAYDGEGADQLSLMAKKSRAFVQKWLLEVRFDSKPSMFWLGSELADRWIGEFPEMEVTLPAYRLHDKPKYRSVGFSHYNAVVDVEGEPDIEPFIRLAVRVAKDIIEIVAPKKLVRLGIRQITLMHSPASGEPLGDILGSFALGPDQWNDESGRDQISDIGLFINFEHGQNQGQIQFGPYVHAANGATFFNFPEQVDVRALRSTFIFNCDYGELSPDIALLDEKALSDWIFVASTVVRDRIEKLRHHIYPKES